MPEIQCSWCEVDTSRVCPICSRSFCQDHASQEDSELCHECGASKDQTIETKEGLVDEEGNSHAGRVLRPVGQYYITTAGEISRMSDEELERFYLRQSLLVKQCEQALVRHQITESMLTLERDERARKSRRAKYQFSPEEVSKDSPDRKLAILAAMIRKSGITKEKLKAMIEAKQKQAKEKENTNDNA